MVQGTTQPYKALLYITFDSCNSTSAQGTAAREMPQARVTQVHTCATARTSEASQHDIGDAPVASSKPQSRSAGAARSREAGRAAATHGRGNPQPQDRGRGEVELGCACSDHIQERDLKDECRTRWDRTGTALTIRQRGRHDKSAGATTAHSDQANVPAANDLSFA
jgi:hypothetical protein